MTRFMHTLRASLKRAATAGALAALAGAPCALAALTDISNNPLASSASVSVKPNLMYLMDTSGSMAWGHMPDDEESQTTKVGYRNYECNTMFYNPNIRYVPPKNADGTNFSNASFTGAQYDGFDTSSPVLTDLSTSFIAFDNTTSSGHGSDTAQAAYYWIYTGSAARVFNTAPCTNSIAASPFTATPSGTWTKVIVSATSGIGGTDERTNFANWYSYYRTRILMNKSAASRSFVQLTDAYRVGFITINPGNPVSSTKYLPIADFASTQKTDWFNKVFTQSVSLSTPLREALSRVGRHYAGKTDGINSGMIDAAAGKPDPVQYSCQQNFTILTTDGYWNGNGPVGLAGGTTTVGNMDNNINATPRPLYDGGVTGTTTVTDKTNTYSAATCTTSYTQPTQRTQQIQAKTQQVQKRTVQNQTKTEQIQQRIIQIVKNTSQPSQSTSQIVTSTDHITSRGNTTNATVNLIVTDVNNPSTLTGVVINGTNRLTSGNVTFSSSNTGNNTARRLAVVNTIAANLSGGYIGISSGACGSSNNSPVQGCSSGNHYVRIMAPAGSGTTITSASITDTSGGGNISESATISNTGVATTNFTDANSCTATTPTLANGGYSNTTNVRTATDCSTRSLTANVSTASCTAGTNNSTGVITTCPTPTVLTTNVPVTSCTPGTSGSGVITTCGTTTTSNVPVASCTAGTSGGITTTCPAPTDTGFVNASSCTATSPSPNSSGQTITCQTVDPSTGLTAAFVNSGVCIASGPTNGQTVTCNVASDTGFVNASSCTASSTSASPTITCQTTDPATGATAQFVNAASCSTSGPTNGLSVACNTTDTGFVDASSCTPTSPSPDATGKTITCSSRSATGVAGQKLRYTTVTTTTVSQVSGSTVVSAGSPSNSAASTIADLDGVCYANPTANQPTLAPFPGIPNPNPQRPGSSGTPLIPAPPASCANWPCTTTATVTGGATDTLADVASYYYRTDLRPSMIDNVPSSGAGVEDDTASWQHMTTFTVGLGLSGTIQFRPDYKTASTGDFDRIRKGTLNWPAPVADDPTALDDLWHAAVDGHGQFFSANDPETLVSGLATALAGVNSRVASAAAAATSNLEPVAGDNFAYTAKYVTQKWIGELEAHAIDLTTGVVQAAAIWSAQGKLDAKVGSACDNRTIYLFHLGVADNKANFTWNTKACDTSGLPTGSASTELSALEQANFDSSKVALLSQYPLMADGSVGVDQRTPAAGANMVNFLRGQRGLENFKPDDVNFLYRVREHVLGDIINAQPVYVKRPPFVYDDAGYADFQSANANRTPMVYVASNDGMLHAFNADGDPTAGGVEAWAWIPTMVLPNMYKLASVGYASAHTYFVDGTPTVGDILDGGDGAWKTILVGGLNGGGRGYYALDVTNPATPKGLWEFKYSTTCYSAADPTTYGSDCNIGYTFGNPLISKLADGTWAVFVTSGYNNVGSPANAGDGLGYLYVLNAATGKIIYKISTGVGSAATPSGLGHINSFIDVLTNNTSQRVYGGDLLGNLWRFDINDTILPAGREATLLAVLKSPNGATQSITTKPEIADVGSPPSPFVFVATGRYLGTSDLSTTQPQSVYAIKDPLTAATYGDLRTILKEMTITTVGSGASETRTIACGANCTSSDGWFADFPVSGERVNVDMKLQLGTLVIESNVPEDSACTIGGFSFLNFFDFATGTAVSNSAGGIVGQKLSDSLAVGLNIVRLPDGRTVVITTTSDAKQLTVNAPFSTPGPEGKRVSWREITQ